MPNGYGNKEYGPHDYGDHTGTSDCRHGCHCWMGPSRSGGPTGLDPFGACPKNPKDGKLLGGDADYDHVVTERIQNLESLLNRAEEKLKTVKPSKKKLAEELVATQKELYRMNQLFTELKRVLELPTI